MKKVRKGLYIGNLSDMYMVLEDDKRVRVKITHILSLLPTGPLHLSVDRGQCSRMPARKCLSEGDLTVKHNDGNVFSRPGILTEDRSVETMGCGFHITRKTVPLNDSVTENLLDWLDSCLEVIHGARERGGNILVHCVAGVSRSAAVIVAYLMRTENLSVKDSLSSLRKESPTACPNKGFMDQLVMFEQMGCKVDPMHPVYKSFKASKTIKMSQE